MAIDGQNLSMLTVRPSSLCDACFAHGVAAYAATLHRRYDSVAALHLSVFHLTSWRACICWFDHYARVQASLAANLNLSTSSKTAPSSIC